MIPQAQFLGDLGIEARLDSLLAGASQQEQADLITGFNRLIGGQPVRAARDGKPLDLSRPSNSGEGLSDGDLAAEAPGSAVQEGMGQTYKVMAITGKGMPTPFPFVSDPEKDISR